MREYRGYLQATRRLAPATVNRHLVTLRAFTSWAVVKGYLDKLPTAEVSSPQTPAWEPRWLDGKDERALVRSVERYGNPRNVAIIVTLLQTSLRDGELVALEQEDVELAPRKGAITVRQGKRDRSREVPLNAEARRVLEHYLAVRPTSSSPRVFLEQRRPIGSEAVQRVVEQCRDDGDSGNVGGYWDMSPIQTARLLTKDACSSTPGDVDAFLDCPDPVSAKC